MTRLKCNKCKKTRLLSKFRVWRGRIYRICKKCVYEHAKLTKRKRTKEEHRKRNLWFFYNITLEQWGALFAKQGKCCAICKRKTPVGRGWATDHKGKKVRGILCSCCNTFIGLAHESVKVLMSAVSYLRKHND